MTNPDRQLRPFRMDLHVHTALSPCAAREMTPPAIIAAAREKGLDMIAVCDHNTAGNAAAVREAAEAAGGWPFVMAGIEITTAEEVHVLGLFPHVDAAERAAARVTGLLPHTADLFPGDERRYQAYFGEQTLLDAGGRSRGQEKAALALATTLSLAAAVALVHHEKGVAVAAHIDRPSYSVYSQLGLFPQEAGFDGAEVSRHLEKDSPRWEEFSTLGLPLLRGSDSHFLVELGTAFSIAWMAEPSFAEFVLCLAGTGGRRVESPFTKGEEGKRDHA